MKSADDPLDAEPEQIAAQQFVHGLLARLHEDRSRRARRMARLMAALDEPAPVLAPDIAHVHAPVLAQGAPVRSGPRTRRLASVAATVVALAAGFLFLTRGESAQALVRESLEALSSAPDRRYEVEILLTEDPATALVGRFDVRDEDHLVLRLDTPHFRAVLGRDEDGVWVTIPGRDDPYRLGQDHGWPQWLRLHKSMILLVPPDLLLVRLLESYELARTDAAPAPYLGVVAERRAADPELPELVTLWIDPATSGVRHVELAWPSATHTLEDFHRELLALHTNADGQFTYDLEQIEPRFEEHEFLAPRRIAFDLTEGPGFPADWFRPEQHRP